MPTPNLMSSEAKQTTSPADVAKQAPTEQQETKPGIPKRFAAGQTVCNEKNEKGKLCNGHLKEVNTQHPSRVFLRGDDTLHRCQACGALYMGPPLGHVRDSSKQTRYVERDLAAILSAAGGTLPAYEYPTPAWRGEPKPKRIAAPKAAPAAKPTAKEKPAADSSPAADAHRPAAEAQAATGQASAAPLSPTASTASPAAGAETVSDLATEASTELTPGAPKDERSKVEAAAPAAPTADAKPKKGAGGFKVPPELQPKPGETFEEKVARLKAINEAAKRASGKL
jgi:hypothetical protein